jgi:RNA polymerase sigma factor (sigma-70 family)
LTEAQRADVERCYPIGVKVAMYFAHGKPVGVTEEDLLSAAHEAIVLAICTFSTSRSEPGSDEWKEEQESYVWLRVHSTLKTLLRQTAERLGLRPLGDDRESRAARAAETAIGEYGLAKHDPSNFWKDGPEQHARQYAELVDETSGVGVLGASGHTWHTRGEEGLVLRAEYVRGLKVLHDEVARLSPSFATVIELRFFRELPVKDVAQKAGVSEQDVPRMIAKAARVLRARLEAKGIDPSILAGR